jgi:hypothetical protein
MILFAARTAMALVVLIVALPIWGSNTENKACCYT